VKYQHSAITDERDCKLPALYYGALDACKDVFVHVGDAPNKNEIPAENRNTKTRARKQNIGPAMAPIKNPLTRFHSSSIAPHMAPTKTESINNATHTFMATISLTLQSFLSVQMPPLHLT
jgi:hypothetical protein